MRPSTTIRRNSYSIRRITERFGAIWALAALLAAAVFVAPLDGSKIALGLMPRRMAASYLRFEPYGPGILLSVILLDILTGIGILWAFIGPAINLLSVPVVGHRIV